MEDSVTKWFVELSKGNPGALNFLMVLRLTECDYVGALCRAESLGITGAKLYMLWNDCCGREVRLTVRALEVMSEEELFKRINYQQGRGLKIDWTDFVMSENLTTAEKLCQMPVIKAMLDKCREQGIHMEIREETLGRGWTPCVLIQGSKGGYRVTQCLQVAKVCQVRIEDYVVRCLMDCIRCLQMAPLEEIRKKEKEQKYE